MSEADHTQVGWCAFVLCITKLHRHTNYDYRAKLQVAETVMWFQLHTAFASLYSETALCEAYENLVVGPSSGTIKWLQRER